MLNEPRRPGRHFLQIPGPTPVPERILHVHAAARSLDHRGPEFGEARQSACSPASRPSSRPRTRSSSIRHRAPAPGKPRLTNTLSPGDHVLMVETGQFAVLWKQMADRLGLNAEVISTDWRIGADAHDHRSSGSAQGQEPRHQGRVRRPQRNLDRLPHASRRRAQGDGLRPSTPLCLMTDSHLRSRRHADLRHDEWGIDVTVAGSQKGMMLPPGLSFTADVSDKAHRSHRRPPSFTRAYFIWDDMLSTNETAATSPTRRQRDCCTALPRPSTS